MKKNEKNVFDYNTRKESIYFFQSFKPRTVIDSYLIPCTSY